MAESYFESLQRENQEYATEVKSLEAEVQRLEILVDEKNRIIASLNEDLTKEMHRVNRLLKEEPYA